MNDHFNPLFVTVLPKERRARHPYQLAVMIALLLIPGTQLLLGVPSNSSSSALPTAQVTALNVMCLLAGFAGLYAAFIPERIVTLFGKGFDATWSRLFVELGSHGLLAFIWASYVATIFSTYPIWTTEGFVTGGVTLGGGLATCLGGAAVARVVQIVATIWGVIGGPNSEHTVIVGEDTVRQQAKGG